MAGARAGLRPRLGRGDGGRGWGAPDETAYPRFVVWADAPDAFTGGLTDEDADRPETYEAVTRLPQLEKAVVNYAPCCGGRDANGVAFTFPGDVGIGIVPAAAPELFGAKMVRGRLFDAADPREATLSFAGVREGLDLGATIEVALPDGSYVPVTIVGIHAVPGEFPAIGSISFPGLALSPAFHAAHRRQIAQGNASDTISVNLWFREGVTVDDVRAELARRRIPVEVPFTIAEHVTGVRRSMRFESLALWMLAGLLAVSTIAILGQALGRETAMRSDDHPTLRALGMSARELTVAGMARATAIGAAAGAVAVVVAIALSPLTPIGLARIAEPDPGMWIDGLVLGLGAPATVAGVWLISFLPSWRAARVAGDAQGIATAARRPSVVAAGLTRASAPVSVVAGARFALEPGRGRTAVPTRSAALGGALGIAAFVAALVFGGSLAYLVRTPRLHGFTWDALVDGDPRDERALRADDRFRVAAGGAINVSIQDRAMLAVVVEEGRGLEPVIAEGRRPQAPDEVALGAATMRRLGAGFGDGVEISAGSPGGEQPVRTISARVVGRAIVPPFIFEAHEPGDGAVLSEAAAWRLLSFPGFDPETGPAQLVAFSPDADRARTIADLRSRFFVLPRIEPAALQAVDDVRRIPLALAAVLGLLAVATLTHALVSAATRRARDLAILKTLGFRRAQVRATMAWHATTVAVVALVVGLPAGIVAGRWGWDAFAEQLAVLPHPVVTATIALGIPAVLVLANLVAVGPSRVAARTPVAVVLRTE